MQRKRPEPAQKLAQGRDGNVQIQQWTDQSGRFQAEYGYSDEETALQIQENPYLQYFSGYPGYDDSTLPFDPSLMVYFRKRLTREILGEINEMILDHRHDDDDRGNGGNCGTMIVDATCAPSGLGLIMTKLRQTIAHSVAMSILALNL